MRAITVRRSAPLPFYGSADTIARLSQKFGYILDENVRPLPGTYKPEGRAHVIRALIDALSESDLDLTGTRSESDLKAVLTARLGRYRV